MQRRQSGSITRIFTVILLFSVLLVACAPAADSSSGSLAGEPAATQVVTEAAPLPLATDTVEREPTQPATETAMPEPSATTAAPAATDTAMPPTETPAQAAGPRPSLDNIITITGDQNTAFLDPAGYTWQPVASGLNGPVDFKVPPDDSQRFFVVEQPGVIRIIQDGAVLTDPFLDIQDRVGSRRNEQGLLGLAFHPDYAQNGFFYLNYTDRNGDTVIARYSVTQDNPDLADPNSESVLLQVDQPYPNHNGGMMLFGPDGYLYIALGDGGSAGDPQGNAQATDRLLGKILRIDVNGSGANGEAYGIPADNPFASGGGRPEVWVYGVRNPWRFSFDAANGDLYIADVGQNQWEEVHVLPAGAQGGANLGWDYREGAHTFEGTPPEGVTLIDPVFEYDHGMGCSVTGGYVYRGQAMPELQGVYFVADYCSGFIWGLKLAEDGSWQAQRLFETDMRITSFGVDNAGELYLTDESSGSVYLLTSQ